MSGRSAAGASSGGYRLGPSTPSRSSSRATAAGTYTTSATGPVMTATSTVLTASPNPVAVSATVTLTATETAADSTTRPGRSSSRPAAPTSAPRSPSTLAAWPPDDHVVHGRGQREPDGGVRPDVHHHLRRLDQQHGLAGGRSLLAGGTNPVAISVTVPSTGSLSVTVATGSVTLTPASPATTPMRPLPGR